MEYYARIILNSFAERSSVSSKKSNEPMTDFWGISNKSFVASDRIQLS